MSATRGSWMPRASQISLPTFPSPSPSRHQCPCTSRIQTRNATFIPRPKRPYTFTQLFTLSDGSTFLHRTTSPAPVYKSTRDTRNTPLWNPSNARMANVEEDEAGRLRAFRRRFGRAFDSREGEPAPAQVEGGLTDAPAEAPTATQEDDGLVKEIIKRDARKGANSEGQRKSIQGEDAEAEARVELSSGRSPPSAAVKGQKEAESTGQGMGTTAGWGEDFGEGDNLMDLISSYGVSEEQQRQQQGQTATKEKGGKRR